MNTKIITAIPFILSILCAVAYQLHGVEIAEDGTLIEAFGFIPLTYLFLFLGIVIATTQFIAALLKGNKQAHQ